MKCRICSTTLKSKLIDLGKHPLSNDYLTLDYLQINQNKYPLVVWVCESCWLVQAEEHASRDIIFKDDYSYFSSTSKSWLEHCEKYTNKIVERFNLNKSSFVIEVASNDGYLLQYFQKKGIKCLGIEPTANTAAVARERGIETIVEFFGQEVALKLLNQLEQPKLIICNNVLAHVPSLIDFVKGLKTLLDDEGVISVEVPSLSNLISGKQFDTIYHEHFSYFSIISLSKLFKINELRIFDVEEIKSHGGSYRVFVCHDSASHKLSKNVKNVRDRETHLGLNKITFYKNFQYEAEKIKDQFKNFLIDAKNSKQKVAAYGAAAKGNTLINFADVGPDLIEFVCDAAPSKQGKFLPGSKIPIVSPELLKDTELDYLVILPWNLAEELKVQLSYLVKRGTKLVTFIPSFKVL